MPPIRDTADRGARLLEEALALLAAGGLGAVTHRAVEAAAGAPHGSVTYWFGSRDGLVAAMIGRLVEQCEGDARVIADQITAAFAAGAAPDAELVAAGLAAWFDASRDLHLARLELELAAVRDERVREHMRDAAQIFWRMCEPLTLAVGSEDPERDGRLFATVVDGLLLDRLAHPPQPLDLIVSAVRILLAPRPSRG
jgi:AcrR family transcriptional regulator